MELVKALRLGPMPRLALVGAGGKTSALFRLGRELLAARRGAISPGNVFLTATTHLAVEQLELADHHFIVETPDELAALEGRLPPGLVLFTGPQVEVQRTAGLNSPSMDRLRSLADRLQTPLIVEADGSRQRPLKAPAAHEPVIPTWVDCVVVVAGLSGLGRPLSPEWVHRPERFSELSGLVQGELVDPAALARVLCDSQGGLKAIPSAAKRVALLNQAGTPERQAQAYDLAKRLLPVYSSVLVAALAPLSSEGFELDDVSGQEGPVYVVHEPVAGIILAGGAASRLGQVKQLLPWRGQSLVWHVARIALAAELSPVVVVTGFSAGDVRAALAGLALEFVHNAEWRSGLSTSVKAGLQALPSWSGAAVFLMADQPQIPPDLVRSLVESHAGSLSPLVAPLIDGRRGNPVLFDCQAFPELLGLSGDAGGRALFARYRPVWVPWHDPDLLLDVDTSEDYQRLLEI
jgi:molybdenum cofactor cytidylyltransferase